MVVTGDIVQFKNCRLIRQHEIIVDDLWIQNGKIIDPEPVSPRADKFNFKSRYYYVV